MLTFLFGCFKMRIKIIRKKEQFENQEHNSKFNQNDEPQFFTYSHRPKALIIKTKDIGRNSFYLHRKQI